MKHQIISSLAAVLMLCSLTGCEEKEAYNVTIRNLTGVEISEIYIRPETDLSRNENLLKEHLPADENATLSLGRLSKEDVERGFALEFHSTEDGTAETFSMLHFESGDTVTVYFDVWGLAVAVNLSDEEVQEQVDSEYELSTEE